jgi:hypothetical protein
MRLAVIFAGIVISISGCASGYEQFYADESAGWEGSFNSPTTEPLKIFAGSGDWGQDVHRMYENGYGRIGSAAFNGSLEGNEGLKKQALKVGANAVIVSSDFTDSVTSSIPITTTQAVTTYHSGSVNSGNFSATSTTYVPTTTHVPVTQRNYDQTAVFFRELKLPCIGFLNGDVSLDLRQRIGTNSGVMVAAVRIGGPAYYADIVSGDVVLEIAGQKIFPDTYLKISSEERVDALIWRRGKLIRKEFVSGSCS